MSSCTSPIGSSQSNRTVSVDISRSSSSNTYISPPPYTPSGCDTPMQKYSVKDSEASYFYIPPCSATIKSEKPITIDAKTGMYHQKDHVAEIRRGGPIDLEWVPHSTPVALGYLVIAISAIIYYSSCFLQQYGNYTHRSKSGWLDEAFLTRVVMVQWLVLATLLVTGLILYRRIMMPLYIFLAVLATNGTLVLFVVKLKQLIDGKIDKFDVSLNLLGLLLFCAIVHDLVYLYAMHLNLAARGVPTRREQSRNSQKYYSTIRSNYYYGPEVEYL